MNIQSTRCAENGVSTNEEWNVSEEEFIQAISIYSAVDYYDGELAPIQYLVNLMHYDYDRYKPYERFLLEDGRRKGVPDNVTHSGFLALLDQLDTIRAVLSLIIKAAKDPDQCGKVSVLPIMCGKGKSSAISYLVKEVIESRTFNGLIIVTDSVKRLEDYTNPSHNPAIKKYFAEHTDSFTVMHSDNRIEALKKQASTPVLFITTQWYCSLSRAEIESLLKWNGGKRSLVIFDERPLIREIIHVERGDLYRISAALIDGIGDTADQVEKQWCIDEWNKVLLRLFKAVDLYEKQYPNKKVSYFFHNNPTHQMTSCDERFEQFIHRNETQLKRYHNGEAYKKLKAVYRIEREGAILQSQKGKCYSNKFSVMIDHQELIKDIGAKVLILDGTAELHPDYKQEYIKLLDYSTDKELSPYVYSNIMMSFIHFVDIPTSKAHFARSDPRNEYKNGIIEYLKNLQDSCIRVWDENENYVPRLGSDFDYKMIPLFTYLELEGYFRRAGFEHIEHFGNIRGKNDYRDYTTLAQVGLNRFEPLYYLSYAINSNPQILRQLSELTQEQASAQIEKIIKNTHSNSEIMYPMILDDIEQNFFRGINRSNPSKFWCNSSFSEYWIFCNVEAYSGLIDRAKQRYEKLGAHVIIHEKPKEFKHAKKISRKNKKDTAYQACTRWIDNVKPGTVFRKGNILEGACVTDKAYDEMYRKTPMFRERLEAMRIPGKKTIYIK